MYMMCYAAGCFVLQAGVPRWSPNALLKLVLGIVGLLFLVTDLVLHS